MRKRLLWLTAAGLSLAVVAWNATTAKIKFTEIGAKAGVRVQHHTRHYNGKHADVLRMFTSGGAAASVADYDNDGFDDVFVTDSDKGKLNHLYHNNGNMTFTDVAVAMGVAGGNDPLSIVADAIWLDYDNDGWQDLMIIRFGTPILYHNEGKGKKFKDVSAQSGLNKFGNTIAAMSLDIDNDGNLDLVFGNYFKPLNLLDLKDPHVLPNDLDNAINGGGVTVWKGNGKGQFVEITEKAGFGKHTGWTLDVGHGDFNNDGKQDIYLACDYGTDRIYFNNGDGTFTDTTEKSLGGFDTRKGMNVDVADYDNDGWLDIYVTNITDEYMKECNMMWHNNQDGTFTDVSKETETCATLWGWSAKFGDWDNDGWQDLYVMNGLRSAGKENYIPLLMPMIIKPGIDFTDLNNWPDIGDRTWSGYQKKKMLHNRSGQIFREISAEAGTDNDMDGRGIGMSDFDNDGQLDLFQTNADQVSLLYKGATEGTGNWVQMRLEGTKSNRDAVGARIKLTAGGLTQIREIDGGNGYAGQSTRRAHFGIGKAEKVDSVEILWPSGKVQKAVQVKVNGMTRVVEAK